MRHAVIKINSRDNSLLNELRLLINGWFYNESGSQIVKATEKGTVLIELTLYDPPTIDDKKEDI